MYMPIITVLNVAILINNCSNQFTVKIVYWLFVAQLRFLHSSQFFSCDKVKPRLTLVFRVAQFVRD